jgi:hypothetical protein
VLLTAGCGAQQTATTPEPVERTVKFSGFSAERLRIAEDVFAKLGNDSLIDAAELTQVPEIAGLPKSYKKAIDASGQVWFAMIPRDHLDSISRFRSEWHARVILAAFWR